MSLSRRCLVTDASSLGLLIALLPELAISQNEKERLRKEQLGKQKEIAVSFLT
jgi:hypothetical protein